MLIRVINVILYIIIAFQRCAINNKARSKDSPTDLSRANESTTKEI